MQDPTLHIMVIADANQNGDELLSSLDASDFTLQRVESDAALSEILQQEGELTDLCLLLGSTEALARLVERAVPVIVLADSDDPHMMADALRDGAQDVVPLADLTANSLQRLLRYAGRLVRVEKQRQKAQTQIVEAESLAHQIMTHSTEGIVIYDRDLHFQFWNPSMEAMTGLAATDAIGKKTSDVFHDLSDSLTHLLDDALAGKLGQSSVVSFETVSTGRSGWFQGTYVPQQNAHGEITGVLALFYDVTDARQLLEAYQEAAEEYRAIFENVSDGIYRTTPEGRQLRANPALVKLNGFESEEEMLNAVEDIAGEWYVDPTRRDEFKRILDEQGRVEDFQSEIYRYRTRERIWISESAHAVYDDDSNVLYYEGTIRDITNYKKNEANLIRANAKLRKAQEIAHLGSWEWNLPGQEMIWSDEMFRICGLASDAHHDRLTVDTFIEYIHADDVSRVLETLLHNLDMGKTEPIEFRIVRSTGEERIVMGEQESVYDEDGKLIRLIGAMQDITERKTAEAERDKLLANLNRLTTQLSAAATVSKSVIAILDTQALIEHTVNTIKQSFNFYYVGMFMVDENGEYAVLQTGTGDAGQQMIDAKHRLLIGGKSMIGQCIESATARIAPDVGEEQAHYENPHLPDTRSELALPLIRRGLCFGALTVQDTASHAFLDSDVTVLQTMVDQVAGAIENARLFEAAQHEINERKQTEMALQISQKALQSKADSLTTLNTIADALHQSLDYQIVLDRALDVLNEYTPAKTIAIFDVDEEKNYMTLIVSHGLSQPIIDAASGGPLDTALAGVAVRTREVVTSNDIANDERLAPEVRKALSGEGLTTIFIVPIIYQNHVLGVLILGFERGTILAAEERETLLAVAHTICLAMANARHVDQIQHEIAERKLAQEEARRLNRELEKRVQERTIRLEAANRELEAFTYSVSHDLRAPLRAIDGFSQALLEDHQASLEAEAQNYLHRLRAASQRMGGLIDDLLMLSRVSRTEMRRQPVNMSEIARTIASELQESAPNRQVEFVIQEKLRASGDPRLMTIMLNNLMGNAWKFTSKHKQARIEFGYTEEQDFSAFFVRDDGAGFDMAFAGNLFGAFQRLHNLSEFEGTGIGLATVQRIIHRHGGQIWAQGEIENGATFYFKLGKRGEELPDEFQNDPAGGR